MANPGVGSKFVSVNLNKSYGQQHQQQHYYNGSNNQFSNRVRPGGGGGGGSNNMVVLSRPRSSQKAAGPKLSVPPPLNLPSLRKEHERFDSLGPGGGHAGGGSGSGPRPTSSGVGWSKPVAIAVQEKEGFAGDNGAVDNNAGGNINTNSSNHGVDHVLNGVVNGVNRGSSSSVYMPPSVRSSGSPVVSGVFRSNPVVEKATVLRGEDFPSLQATLPAAPGTEKKQKDALNQKQKQLMGEELSSERKVGSQSSMAVDMRPQLQSRNNVSSGFDDNGGQYRGLGGSVISEKERKQEDYFPGPLPLVRLNPRSDWEDDERDTRFGFTDRGRDHGTSRKEAYWERDFDFPRPSVLPQKPTHYLFDRRGQHDSETGKAGSSETTKADTYGRDIRMPSREGPEGHSWRTSSPHRKDGFNSHEVGHERNGVGVRSSTLNREITKDNRYASSPFRENAQDDIGRKDVGHGGGRQPWNSAMDSFSNRGSERNSRESYGNEQYNKYRGNSYQNNTGSKSSFTLGSKGLPVNDPILNFGREKLPFLKSEKPYLEDFSVASFDGRDLFSSGLVGLVKKKKDVQQTDFHDPVRESFEAELERVQKMQEQERQRMIEEQERAVEVARREEEERILLAREHEERQRRLEEEAREAAWRAEQERSEAMRRAEEQRIAREEEKRRVFMEEERRKQAAKQKLLELEEKIAKRGAEVGNGGSISSSAVMDEKTLGTEASKDFSKVADIGDWEDGERMVESITTLVSSDSYGINRPFDMGSRPSYPTDGSSFSDRGKPVSPWKRDAFDSGNSSSFLPQDQENGHRSPRRDAPVGGRTFSRKEYQGGPGLMASRPYHKGGFPDPHMDDFGQLKGQRWNVPGDIDHYSRNMEMEPEFHDNQADRFGDAGWGQGRSRGNPYPSYNERMYHNPEVDGLYSFGRSRYPVRQPRVLPPPATNSMQRPPYRGLSEHAGPSTFPGNDMQYKHGARNESTIETRYDSSHQVTVGRVEIIDAQQENTMNRVQKLDRNAARCDSQSSLSVSSPPDSPLHLSHDDLDESGDSSLLSAAEGKDVSVAVQKDEPVAVPVEAERETRMSASSIVSTGDDEEWTIENDEQVQEQEEYDEDDDGYEEEDEVHDVEDENVGLTKEFEDMCLDEKDSPNMTDNLVLGFNEGVEVALPNDEFQKSSRNGEANFVMPHISVGTLEEQGSFDGMRGDGQLVRPAESATQVSTDNSSKIFEETERAKQDLVIQPRNMSQSFATSNQVDASSNAGLSTQAQISSSGGQAVMSTVPSVLGQPEVPIKLQFGLFSGPSLIPSPVPAIQIGSIQMPLHLHPSLGPSLTHIHPSQPPLFQFGQLRYTTPISPGVLPLAPQPMSFMQPNVSTGFSSSQKAGAPLPTQPGQETSAHSITRNGALSISSDKQPGLLPQRLDLSISSDKQPGLLPQRLDLAHGMVSKEGNSLPPRGSADSKAQQSLGDHSHINDSNSRTRSGFQAECSFVNNFKTSPTQELEGQPHNGMTSSQSALKEVGFSKSQSGTSVGRGKKYVYTVKKSVPRSSFQAPEVSHPDSNRFQRRPRRPRTEFRVRENVDKRQSSGLISSNFYGSDDKSYISGKGSGARSGSRRVVVPNRQLKQARESEGISSQWVSSQESDSTNRAEKSDRKESMRKDWSISHSGDAVDAPLQSGIVRVFEQPGIEAPSDDDDFIEVRSKRQMLNDRREQREKEIKAKSRISKMPQKHRSTLPSTGTPIISNKKSASAGGQSSNRTHTEFAASGGHGFVNSDVSSGFNTPQVSQPLPPIGTPAGKIDPQADLRSQTVKSLQTISHPVSVGAKNLSSGSTFESKNKVLDNVQTSLGSWGNSRMNQQVMALTQTQLDEAMKPVQFDSHTSVGDPTNSVGESSLSSSSILTKDKSFSSAVSPINSLLAGEKIQFGAVTSPTILPPGSRSVSHGIGPPGPCRSDIPISHSLPASENDCALFFEKEKHSNESCAHLQDCEDEAEAAASAVAAAAISGDEVVGNGLGMGPDSGTDSKSFGGPDMDGITAGVSGDQQLASHSRAEESLSVALPADLSVETPPISLWPPLPSPQNSSGQILPHVPGGPHSHFPYYEMSPMMGAPIFAFGPHDESASSQSQSQKSGPSVSGPLGAWQHHSGVDSFYGTPAGFTGPFISPAGSIPGVQGPPMVVYNHFAPVGQFGQVGLSFMGTYIPSGKQPDWKHNPASSSMGMSEGELNNLNMASAQRNPNNIPAPIQHLAPGSPLLPMPSHLPIFDVSPFQTSPDLSVHTRWSHVPAPALQSVPVSMPLQQQSDGVHPSQFNHGPTVDQPLAANRFSESGTPTPSDVSRNFPVANNANVTKLPDELGLVDSSSSVGGGTSNTVSKRTSVSTVPDAVQSGSNNSSQTMASGFKTHHSHQKNASTQQYNNSSGYNYQNRGGSGSGSGSVSGSQKNSSGGEWSHRRMGYQGRNQSLGAEKSFPSAKTKQIYVAKQTANGTSTS